MSDKVYDFLNKLERWLPALGVLYLTISNIWELPFGDQVSQTVVAVATFIAAVLEISTVVYRRKMKEVDGSTDTPLEATAAEEEEDIVD